MQDVTWANWFGGIYKDPQEFLRAVRRSSRRATCGCIRRSCCTPEEKQAFLEDRTGCIVGDGLARQYGFKIGDRIVLQVGIPIYGTQDYDFTIRGIYTGRRQRGRQPDR